jgi:hypothetical protein
MILLDQSVQTKMKISKAFAEKLKTFGDTDRFGLNWHPGTLLFYIGWKDPPDYVPELDCDPYYGACSGKFNNFNFQSHRALVIYIK